MGGPRRNCYCLHEQQLAKPLPLHVTRDRQPGKKCCRHRIPRSPPSHLRCLLDVYLTVLKGKVTVDFAGFHDVVDQDICSRFVPSLALTGIGTEPDIQIVRATRETTVVICFRTIRHNTGRGERHENSLGVRFNQHAPLSRPLALSQFRPRLKEAGPEPSVNVQILTPKPLLLQTVTPSPRPASRTPSPNAGRRGRRQWRGSSPSGMRRRRRCSCWRTGFGTGSAGQAMFAGLGQRS